MSDVKWIKLVTGFFEDEKVRLIESMPDADTILIIWIKLLTLAGRKNEDGLITLSPILNYSDEMLATLLNRSLNTVRLALNIFVSYTMIEIDELGRIFIINWAKHQNAGALEQIREQGRLRVARFRERKQLENGNVTVTLRNALEKNRIEKIKTVNIINTATGKKPGIKTDDKKIKKIASMLRGKEALISGNPEHLAKILCGRGCGSMEKVLAAIFDASGKNSPAGYLAKLLGAPEHGGPSDEAMQKAKKFLYGEEKREQSERAEPQRWAPRGENIDGAVREILEK